MKTTTTKATAETLATALADRGHRAEVFPADPPRTKVDAVNIWYDASDRYPSDTAWEPYEADGWEWGRNYEHHAPAEISADELAQLVVSTLRPRN